MQPYRKDTAGRGHPWPWNGPPAQETKGVLVLRPVGQ